MSATKTAAEVPSEVDAELQEAIRRAMSGVRDPEEMRKACERIDQIEARCVAGKAAWASPFPQFASFAENSPTSELRQGCDFITVDDKLVKNLRPIYPFIVPLGWGATP